MYLNQKSNGVTLYLGEHLNKYVGIYYQGERKNFVKDTYIPEKNEKMFFILEGRALEEYIENKNNGFYEIHGFDKLCEILSTIK